MPSCFPGVSRYSHSRGHAVTVPACVLLLLTAYVATKPPRLPDRIDQGVLAPPALDLIANRLIREVPV